MTPDLPSHFALPVTSLGRQRPASHPPALQQLSNLLKCLEAAIAIPLGSRAASVFLPSSAAMRPSKLILSVLCVALLAAELASAEASPPYEEVAEDARVQGRF